MPLFTEYEVRKILNGPISQYDAMRPPCPIIRKKDSQNRSINTGEWKPGFEWIQDIGVKCFELVYGINITIDIETDIFSSVNIVNIYTRNTIISPIKDYNVYNHILESLYNYHKRKPIPKGEVRLFATLVPKYDYSNYNNHEYYIFFRNDSIKKSYTNWGSQLITIENISNWLKDDLESKINNNSNNSKYNVYRGFPIDTLEKNYMCNERPYGLMFTHPDGRIARIRCCDFLWYWEELENKHKPKKLKREKIHMTKDTWNNLTEEQKQQIRNSKGNLNK